MRKRRFPRYPSRPHHGRARITLAGVDHYLGAHGSPESWQRYHELLAAWTKAQTDGATAASRPGKVVTVQALLAAWAPHCQQHYRHPDGTPTPEVEAYRQAIRPLLALHGRTRIEDFGPRALKEVQAAMVSGSWMTLEERAEREGRRLPVCWARKTVNQRINKLRHIWKWAASEELIPWECYDRLRTVQGLQAGRTAAAEYDEVPPVADAVVDAVLPHLAPVLADMVRLQRLTGMRPGEVCGLTPGEIDQAGLRIDGVTVWVYRPSHHKTAHKGRRRLIALGPQAQAVLLPYLDRPADRCCFTPAENLAAFHRGRTARNQCGRSRARSDVTYRGGERYTSDSYGKAVRRACRAHGIPEWSPGQLRHTAATKIEEEFSLSDAQAVLGHASANTTKIYANDHLTRAATVAARIG